MSETTGSGVKLEGASKKSISKISDFPAIYLKIKINTKKSIMNKMPAF